MSTYLPLNNGGLVLLAINGSLVRTAPTETINLDNVISVLPGVITNSAGVRVKTVQISVAGTNIQADTYDFQAATETDATATAGFTVGAATNNDQARITVNGVTYTVTASGASTAATIKTAMDALLAANTQGFTFTSSNTTGVLLWNFTAPANSGSLWNTLVVNTTFPTNVGPMFSAAVHTNFANGVALDAVATAGATVGSVTAGDAWTITVDGVAFTYTTSGGDTATIIQTAMSALLTANTQGFTYSTSLIGGAIKYYITAPANSGSYWNGRTVNSTFPTNVGPTFSAAVHTNFASGVGPAEQLQAFMTAQSLTSTLLSFTATQRINDSASLKGASIMLNNKWIVSKTYGTTETNISYNAPLIIQSNYYVLGNQTA